MDATRARRTKDQARHAWYAVNRQRRFARHLGFGPEFGDAHGVAEKKSARSVRFAAEAVWGCDGGCKGSPPRVEKASDRR